MKRIAMVVGLIALYGCQREAVSENGTNNPEVRVQELFTHEGCTVYRFHDGETHYYAVCGDRATVSVGHRRSCGKNCSRLEYDEVATARLKEEVE